MSATEASATGAALAEDPLPLLAERLRAALSEARALVRAERFFAVVDQGEGAAAEKPSLTALAPVFRGWRRALRARHAASALEAAEVASRALEAFRLTIMERDRAIRAYRVRWACEHELLGARGSVRLARFYRLLPYSAATQSKYEFVLTRLLAGPVRPRRTLAAAPEALVERLWRMERAWGARPAEISEAELTAHLTALAGFAREANEYADLAALQASGLFRRAGAYKAGLGERLYEPRITVAAVQCGVALGNAFCELLARDEGRELEADDDLPAIEVVLDEETQTEEVQGDQSALEHLERLERLLGAGAAAEPSFERAAVPPHETRTSEAATPQGPSLEVQPGAGAAEPTMPAEAGLPPTQQQTEEEGAEEPPLPPSPRAGELGKLKENAALIVAYLTPPRSSEVYQLDLDMFLGPLPADASERLGDDGSERRRAFELILAGDDVIWSRAGEEGPAGDEHRARVKQVAKEMTALGTALHGLLAKAQQGVPEAIEPLLYVSDHLVWERLRLETSIRRAPRRRPSISLAQSPAAAAEASAEPRAEPRQRRSLAAALVLVTLASAALGLVGALEEPLHIDAEVRVLDPKTLPGADYVVDARTRRSILFVTVASRWSYLSETSRRDHLRELGRFASEQELDIVSVSDASGEPRGSFADGQPMLADDAPEDPEPVPR